MRYLLAHTDDKRERAYLINHFLDQFKGTVYRQTMFAEFELEMGRMAERGEALTADALCEKYLALNRIRSIGQSYSTRWLTNANYLNLRTVTLAYNLPKSILNVINIKSARVNVSAENLFMLKARQGLNPQANYAGVSYNEYMPAKNFTIGLNVSF